jgi:hypothetical protein
MTATRSRIDVPVKRLDVFAYTVPTDYPGSDGTATWDATTLGLVEAGAGDQTGLGWTYGTRPAGR